MNEELTGLFVQYAEVSQKEKEIETQKKALKSQIEDLLPSEPYTEKTQYGTFKMVGYPKITYTDAVNNLTEDLKMLKIEEEESGIATKELSFGLRFNAKK